MKAVAECSGNSEGVMYILGVTLGTNDMFEAGSRRDLCTEELRLVYFGSGQCTMGDVTGKRSLHVETDRAEPGTIHSDAPSGAQASGMAAPLSRKWIQSFAGRRCTSRAV